MVKTKDRECGNKISVDINGLMAMLSVGRKTATQIGDEAAAVVRVGRRKLYNVQKIQQYLDEIAGA